ncbi:helix-turn-helix transcriptional regulator [Rhodococcus spelaei]|uniref:Helix-turn-helix transcriptional regulator n=1 Tax=Rhodococcus spelaei TaxID=2546320 RepID=A0A541BA47_9NOCA|nr:helix-turn-helix transcriptional regulator [Rhodococcus spelaei]
MTAALDQHLHRPPGPEACSASRVFRKPALSPREVEVLLGWLRCDSKNAVAVDLFLSVGTVNTHLARIRAKYRQVGRPAPTKAALVARAVQDGMISLDEL